MSLLTSHFSPVCTIRCYYIVLLNPCSCPSRITTNCLTQLYTDISRWPNIHSHLYLDKPPSHLHHLDKKWDRALWWQQPLLVSVTDQQRASHLCEHFNSNRETSRTVRMPCHYWRTGESANIHTKCQKEYNSGRSVVSKGMSLSFLKVLKTFSVHIW